ncbi:DUF6328 family protein [Geotalea sp. SG265]|uniref:DUF6328 family protein n=1 Tax=Geotalea sp. SG265 TaxID=2922867 RepID=UPI001FAF404E
MREGKKQQLTLPEVVTHILEECRMVLPGIQALFGFQLIAVFNQGFAEKLTSMEQYLHLAAIGLVAIAVALVMTPAAYHRQSSPEEATADFITISTRLLLYSMFPLMLGICLDFYIIATVITRHHALSALLSALLLSIFSALWFMLPWRKKN